HTRWPRDWSSDVCSSDLEHLCLPMRFERGRMKATSIGWTDERTQDGELLAKKQFPDEKVRAMEISLGSYGSAGQLQQRPAPRSEIGRASCRERVKIYMGS